MYNYEKNGVYMKKFGIKDFGMLMLLISSVWLLGALFLSPLWAYIIDTSLSGWSIAAFGLFPLAIIIISSWLFIGYKQLKITKITKNTKNVK